MVTWCPGENISFSHPFSWLTSFWWCHHREQETTVWDHFSTPTGAFCWLLVNLSARMTSNVGANITSLRVTLIRRHNIRHGILRIQHMKCFYVACFGEMWQLGWLLCVSAHPNSTCRHGLCKKPYSAENVALCGSLVCVTQYVQPLWTFYFS